MHELSIAQSIVDIVQQTASSNGAGKVRTIRLRIGELAGVVTDSLEFCITAITAGTDLEGVRLDIESIPLRAQCGKCGKAFAVENNNFFCPGCESGECTVVSGRELQVTEIELGDGSEEAR
jgi:hydrogenase nickel incorporation protein HypA/HybF